MRALIAGCGYVGTALGELLVTDGWEVFGLRRDPRDLPDGIEPIAADLSEPASLDGLPTVDCAIVTLGAKERTPQAYKRAYVTALANLQYQLERQSSPPERWIFTSSTAVYGDSEGEWVDELTSTQPSGFAGRMLLRGEEIIRTAPWPGVVLRLGGIYGPGRTRLVDEVRSGRAAIPSNAIYTNRIHRDDCAGALRHLLHLEDPEPIYNGTDGAPALLGEVIRWLAERLDAPEPPTSIERSGRGSKRVRNARLLDSGYELIYPTYREGYAAMLAD